MMPALDPEKVAKVQEVSGLIVGNITVDHTECSIKLKLSSPNADSKKFAAGLITQFAQSMATQLKTFFNISGEITNVNRPKA